MSSSAPRQQQQRLTLRQADAEDRRRRMTKQRHELTHRIRKQKKSEYLARKRQYATTAPASMSNAESVIDFVRPLIHDFCSIPNIDKLKALHDALQVTTLTATEDNWLVVLPADDAITASSLIGHLQGPASTEDGLPLVLNILVRLTAISYTPPTGYYGNSPLSWSSLVLHNGAWLSLLVQVAPRSETACVVLGNLVGEANTQSFVKLRQAGLIPALLSAVHQPAAAWALTNAIRHDTAEYAKVYCNDTTLSPSLLEHLLKEPAVATQAAWMVATLTNREEDVVQYMMNHPTFPSTLIECMKRPASKDRLAPLVQALGNIATCCVSEGGPPFSGEMLTKLPTLTPMLGQLLQIPTNREVVNRASWLAGCLLHDAGIPNHPSTTIAAPTLVPLLYQELRENTPHSLENQRELTHALWNALTNPVEDEMLGYQPLPLPSWEKVRPALSTLVKLAGSVDADAAMAAVSVLELLMQQHPRNLEQFKEALHEQDITNVLEKVCDSHNEHAAEVAANLLDNYFYSDEDHTEDPDMAFGTEPNGTYSFGLAPEPSTEHRGLGRGRGATLPAWMSSAGR